MHDTHPLDLRELASLPVETPLRQASAPVRRILERALAGQEITRAEGEALFSAPPADLPAIVRAADAVRAQRVGEQASFIVVRNINFTNVCYMGCRFCGFARRKEDPEAVWHSMDEVAHRAQVAGERGATEICMQGGLHPELPPTYY